MAAIFWSFSERERIIAARQNELGRLTTAVEEQVLRILKLSEAAILSTSLWIENNPSAFPGADPGFIDLVKRLRRVSDDTLDIRLVDAQGNLYVLPADARRPVANISDREDIQTQRNPITRGMVVGNPVISAANGQWIVPITYPVIRPDGSLVIIAAKPAARPARMSVMRRHAYNCRIRICRASHVPELFQSL